MIHLLLVWDRTPQSDYLSDLFESVGFIQTTTVSSEEFLQHPQVPDTVDALLLIGTIPDDTFRTTAKRVREYCPDCVLFLSTTTQSPEHENICQPMADIAADLFVLRNPEINAQSLSFREQILRLLKETFQYAEEESLKFREIAENANYGIMITDPYASILYANRCFTTIFGYSQEEITGKTVDELYPTQRTEIEELKQRLFLERHVELEEFIATRKDNTTFPTQAHLQVMFDKNGTPLFVSGIVIDITEQKKAEEERERARYSIDNVTDEVYWILRDGRFFDVNKTACAVLGYTKEELLSRTVFDVDPDITKADWETHWQNISENTCIRIESHHLTKDRKIYPVEISANYFQYGENTFNCAFARDITERKETEEKLLRSEEQLRLKLNAIFSPDYVVEEEEFRNIINSDAIQSLMDDFYELTHIGIGIIDTHGTILIGTGIQDICTKFHQVNPETQKNCITNDTTLTKNIAPGEIRYHTCTNNMRDAVTPISIGQKHMANIFLGPFFYDDEEVDTHLFAKHAERYGFDTDAYLAALERVPRWSHEKVETAIVFYQKFARIVSDLSYSNLKLTALLEHHKQTEEQLAFSEEKYRNYIDIAPEGVFVTDAKGQYLEVNQAACDLLGYTQEELLSMDITQIVPPEELDASRHHFRSLQERGTMISELNLRKKDGTICTVNLGATLLPDGTFIGFTSDVTERKHTEERILHLNRLLGAIRNVNQLIVQEKDPQVLIQKTCNILTDMGGYSGVWIALVGEDDAVLTSAGSDTIGVSPAIHQYLKDGILPECAREALKNTRDVEISVPCQYCEESMSTPSADAPSGMTTGIVSNNTVYGVISASVPPHLASDPEEQALFTEVAGDLGFALYSIELDKKRQKVEEEIQKNSDILNEANLALATSKEELRRNLKELVESQQELQESKERLSQIIEFLPDATFAVDITGHVIAWNKAIAEMTGTSQREMLGKGDYEYGLQIYGTRQPILIDYILHPEFRDFIRYPKWHEEGDTLVAENYVPNLFDRKGAHIWFTACRLYDSEGNITGAIESIRDITEMKKAEERIQETSRDLAERVKELTCLRKISDIMLANPSEEELYTAILQPIQVAMFYPKAAEVAVYTGTHIYHTEAFQETGPEIRKPFSVDEEKNGSISIRYPEGHPEGEEKTFLPEEESLLKIICERISTFLIWQTTKTRLFESEEKYRELFNNMSSGVAVYEITEDGQDFIFRDINKAAEEIDHIRREDVIGKSLNDTFPGVAEFGLPAVLQRVWKTGNPEHFPLTEYRDEQLQGWRENYVYQLPSGEIVAVYDDLTEKKQALDALVESEHKYHEIFNNINEAVFLHEVLQDNSRGHFIEVNDVACRRLGYSREELLNLTVTDINTTPVQKEDPARVVALKTGKEISFDAEHVRKDGSVFPVHVNARLIVIRERKFILSLVRDLTEERAARERETAALKQIEENLAQLGILNDEIRNPLAVITGIIGFTDDKIAEPVMEQVHAIDDIVHRLDQGWLESEKIREYLKKHHDIF